MELVLQGRELGGYLLETVERQCAHAGSLQRNGIAAVLLVADRVQAEQFAGHVEPHDLRLAILGRLDGFQGAGANDVDEAERLPGMEQLVAARQRRGLAHERIEPIEILQIDPGGQAERTE
ncbi:MAG: hypothetical protein U5K33_04760 [Halofilum sp. (in: g-proteobacteria)]|nr:hypothetical protein [Halofilum sp. (in: g-proteobacteria)]